MQAQLRYSDGSVLIFAGEVVDRGLRAGVIVAFLIGAIRMATEVDPDPIFILRALNRRLMGQENAAVICLALRIAPDGLTTFAGHPPPYRNGWPVAMEGASPLGVFKDAEPSVMRVLYSKSKTGLY